MFKKIALHHFCGIFTISFATLLLELSLTRVLSVSLWYHFGFLIISTALLGFGAAGVTLSISSWLREKSDLDSTLSFLSFCFAFSTVACFWLMQKIPFDPFSLLSDRNQLFYMPLYYVVVVIPFYFSGLTIGILLTRGESSVNRLYAWDLLGAGLGCAAIAVVMPNFGGSGSVAISSAFGAAAGSIFMWQKKGALFFINASAFGCLVLLSFFGASTLLPISLSTNKGMRLKTMTPVYSAWNTFSKIDVFDLPEDTSENLPRKRLFVIDAGTAATSIADISKGIDQVLLEIKADSSKRKTISSLRVEVAALGKSKPKVLIIGSGAGDETLESLIIGASSVTAVELNPIIVDVQANRMKDFWGGIYNRPEVKLVNDEGRNFVKRSKEKYDIIVSSHTISNAAVASGALSLSENYVLTKEAVEDYLDHLAPDGVLFFTRPEIQLPRLFSTATEILRERGIQSPADHMFAYSETGARDKDEKYKFIAGFLLKQSPLTKKEVNIAKSLLGFDATEALSNAPERKLLYSPFMNDHGSIYHEILTSNNLKALYSRHSRLLAPTTDDKPFFNQRVKWSSLNWKDFRDIFTQNNRGRLALEDKPVAEITLVIILLQSLIIAAVLILLPLWKFSRQGLRAAGKWNYLIYFAGLGLGFILIEIAFLQRFNLYLGQPVYTYAVVLASLLVFTGLGSYSSERFFGDGRIVFVGLIPAILITLLATALFLPIVFNLTLHLSLAIRAIIAMILIAPLGLVLGMPFPLGLRLIRLETQALAPWAWGVNGFFTVIGSVSAIIMGMALGFTFVLAIAAACYIIAGLAIAYRARKKTTESSMDKTAEKMVEEVV